MWGSSTTPQRPAAWQALKARCIARIFASLTGSLAQPSAKTAGMNIPAVVRMGGQKQGHGEAKGASQKVSPPAEEDEDEEDDDGSRPKSQSEENGGNEEQNASEEEEEVEEDD